MLTLKVYAPGLKEMDKVLKLDHQLELYPMLHYKVDTDHEIVYFEVDENNVVNVDDIRQVFRNISIEPKFIGEIPIELKEALKTRRMS